MSTTSLFERSLTFITEVAEIAGVTAIAALPGLYVTQALETVQAAGLRTTYAIPTRWAF